MRRTTSLTTALLAGLAPALVLLAPSGATAAGETCRGVTATIVGVPGEPIVGTEGPDVVATNSSPDVSTLGGDDLVCVTGRPANPGSWMEINTGAGDDVVDGRPSPRSGVDVQLGQGADRFEGGDEINFVHGAYAYSPETRDTEVDVILGGAGREVVESGSDGPNADVIDLRGGDDILTYSGTMALEGSITGGDGRDAVHLDTEPGVNRIDNATGQLVVNGSVTARWTGLEEFHVESADLAGPRDLELIGSDADEALFDKDASDGRATLSFGAGDDRYLAHGAASAGSRIDAGPGEHDALYVVDDAGLSLDLASGRLELGGESPYAIEAPGFDDASLFAPEVRVVGSAAGNVLSLKACRGLVRGRGGDDTIKRAQDDVFESGPGCREAYRLSGGAGDDRLVGHNGADVLLGGGGSDRLHGGVGRDRLLGGAGDDVLLGSVHDDTLLGGAGRDRAHGGMHRDRCDAERETRCER